MPQEYVNAEESKNVADAVTALVRKFDAERERLEDQIKSADREIDALVYELYGLTAEEIKIGESS